MRRSGRRQGDLQRSDLQLVGRLQRLKTEPNGREIEDFDSYVAVTAYNACDRFLSRKYPNRRRLKNGLRYLLAHRENLAVWQDANGVYVGGFRRWQFVDNESSSLKMEHLRDDARAFERDVKVEKSWSEQKNAFDLLTAIFNWTNAPVEIDLLTSVCAEWRFFGAFDYQKIRCGNSKNSRKSN